MSASILWREKSDQQIEAILEGLGYDADHERTGQFRIFCTSESEATEVSHRVKDALREPYADLIYSATEWMIDSWPLTEVRWADFGEETPVDDAGTPYPYAVVVACPWRLGGSEDFGDLIDRLLEDYGVDGGRAEGERRWWVRYGDEAGADPAALVSSLKSTLGWWTCYGLEFSAERSESTIHLALSDASQARQVWARKTGAAS